MTIQRVFSCPCGAKERHGYEDTPTHCGKPMTPGAPIFPNEDPATTKMHMIKVLNPKPVNWQLPGEPLDRYELWQLKAGGRGHSEFLGHLGRRLLTWEWIPPVGIGTPPGFAASGELAAQCLLLAMDGDGVARRVIAEIAS